MGSTTSSTIDDTTTTSVDDTTTTSVDDTTTTTIADPDIIPTTVQSPPITQGAQVEAESVTRSNGGARLPSTGADGTTTMVLFAGGFLVIGGLLLAARRRVATVDAD